MLLSLLLASRLATMEVLPLAGSSVAASGAPQPAVAVGQLMKLSFRLASWQQAVLLSLQSLYCRMLCHSQIVQHPYISAAQVNQSVQHLSGLLSVSVGSS